MIVPSEKDGMSKDPEAYRLKDHCLGDYEQFTRWYRIQATEERLRKAYQILH